MTTSYEGSTISLISRSGIRYVGILHCINSQDSTVSLEQVRSFGTEGRRGNPADEIPPSDNVFEYIVFRGSDVKDLQVFEPPAAAPPQQPQVPNDPAILGTTAPRPPYGHTQQMPPSGPYPGTPYATQQPGYPQYWQQQQPGLPTSQSQQTRAQAPAVDEPHPAEKNSSEPRPSQDAVPDNTSKSEMTTAAVEQLAKKVSELGINGAEFSRTAQQTRLPGTGGYLQQQQTPRRGVRGGRGGRGGYGYDSRNQNRIPAVPGTDFDFESANAKFNKDEIVKEVLKKDQHSQDNGQFDGTEEEAVHELTEEDEVVIPPPQDFYDRSKSFFDNISCEAKERSEGGGEDRRSRSYQERKLNIETFGQTSIDQGRFRGRGRGGWRGGRGGYNSRGGHARGGFNGGYRGGYHSSGNYRGGARPQQSSLQTL